MYIKIYKNIFIYIKLSMFVCNFRIILKNMKYNYLYSLKIKNCILKTLYLNWYFIKFKLLEAFSGNE